MRKSLISKLASGLVAGWVGVAAFVSSAHADIIPQAGVSYSYVAAPHSNYADSTPPRLTDGLVNLNAASLDALHARSVGWLNPASPQIRFNLGSAYLLDAVAINYSVNDGFGYRGWSGWTVQLSNNADMSSPVYTKTFSQSELEAAGWHSEPLHVKTFDGEWLGQLAIAPAQAAQYVEIAGTQIGDWGFLSEVQFSQIPEPASLMILALVAVPFIDMRKRA